MNTIKTFSEFNSQFKNKFYLFGSEDSKDYDILVEVDSVPQNVDDAHNICKKFNEELSQILPDKEINSNIGVFQEGKLIFVFKGSCDELSNVLYYTYDNHKQFYPNPISSPIERDLDLKIVRVARFIITFYSRTHLRSEIKPALRGNLQQRIDVLKKIDFTTMREFPNKKEDPQDVWKVIAFQFGQVFSIVDGKEDESYTKNGISKNYPDLSNFLSRKLLTNQDFLKLNECLDRFIEICEEVILRKGPITENLWISL